MHFRDKRLKINCSPFSTLVDLRVYDNTLGFNVRKLTSVELAKTGNWRKQFQSNNGIHENSEKVPKSAKSMAV